MDADRVAKAIRQYNARLSVARKTSHRFYHKNAVNIGLKRLLHSIASGHTPTKGSVDKYDRSAITEAWYQYVADQTELTNRQRAFHLFLTGSEFVPICKCV